MLPFSARALVTQLLLGLFCSFTVLLALGEIAHADGVQNVSEGAGFNAPGGVAVTAEGDIVVADSRNSCVSRVSSDGQKITRVAGTGKDGSNLDENSPLRTELN